MVGTNFEWIGNDQHLPCNDVEKLEKEYACDNQTACSNVSILGELLCTNCPDDECDEGAARAPEEECPASECVHEETADDRNYVRPECDHAVDKCTFEFGIEPGLLQYWAKVVGDEKVTG